MRVDDFDIDDEVLYINGDPGIKGNIANVIGFPENGEEVTIQFRDGEIMDVEPGEITHYEG